MGIEWFVWPHGGCVLNGLHNMPVVLLPDQHIQTHVKDSTLQHQQQLGSPQSLGPCLARFMTPVRGLTQR